MVEEGWRSISIRIVRLKYFMNEIVLAARLVRGSWIFLEFSPHLVR